MFVMTAKISKSKLIAAGVIIIAVIALIIALASSGGAGTQTDLASLPTGETNDERVAFLATYGWSVNAEPTQAQLVKIPETADNEVFARYNELQKSQEFDLTQFAGKEVMRYAYEILNYPDASDPVYASILVYEGHIVGGDITNTAPDGIIHGFKMPSGNQSTSPTAPESSEATEETEAAESGSAETEPAETESTKP